MTIPLCAIGISCAAYLFAVAIFSDGYGGPNSPGWRWKWRKPRG